VAAGSLGKDFLRAWPSKGPVQDFQANGSGWVLAVKQDFPLLSPGWIFSKNRESVRMTALFKKSRLEVKKKAPSIS
jgi:hypothetical protein